MMGFRDQIATQNAPIKKNSKFPNASYDLCLGNNNFTKGGLVPVNLGAAQDRSSIFPINNVERPI